MDAFIAIFIVGFIFLYVSLYARAAYVRRHEMLPRVMSYLKRNDVSPLQKRIAQEAFKDALSISMPLAIHEASERRKRKETPPEVVEAQDNVINIISDEAPANAELLQIIYLMFKINISFNFVLHLLVALLRCRLRVSFKGKVAEAGKAYADIKIQHQN